MSGSMGKLKQVRLTELVLNPKNDIVDGPFGSRLKASEYVDAGVPIVRLQNIDRNRFIDKNIKFVTEEKAQDIARHHFVSGDILVSKLGDPLGEACVAPEHLPYGILVADVVRVRPDRKKVDTDFLAYALNSSSVVAQFTAETKGTTRPRVNLKQIRDLQIPIAASLHEQRRIVAEIEKQFTRLESGVAALRRVQANLKRYRAAVLTAACEGKLVPTEAELAQAEHRKITIDSGEALLAGILAERRKNWKGRGEFIEPMAPDASCLPQLLNGWGWATIEQLSTVVRGASPRPAGDPRFFGGNVPWITVGPLTADNNPYLYSVPHSLNELGREHSRYIEPQTLLLTNSGATLGVPKISQIGGCINDGVAALLDVGYPLKLYLLYFLRTQTERLRGVNQGAAQPNLNTTIIKGILVPLPPIAEQQRIVEEIERRLSVVEALEAFVSMNLKRTNRLRQSILHQAFSGRFTAKGKG